MDKQLISRKSHIWLIVQTHQSKYQNKVTINIIIATFFSGIKSGVPSDILAYEYSMSVGRRVIANLFSGNSKNQKNEPGMIAMSILVKLQTIC